MIATMFMKLCQGRRQPRSKGRLSLSRSNNTREIKWVQANCFGGELRFTALSEKRASNLGKSRNFLLTDAAPRATLT
jgi:hypothetical protein